MGASGGVVTDDPRRELRVLAGVLAAAVALLHLFHPRLGASRLITLLEIGELYHPLPPVFTAVAVLIVFGMLLVYQGVMVRWVYLAGILLMLGLIVGYGVWHTYLEHGAFWYGGGYGHPEGNPVILLLRHLQVDTLGAVSKVMELLLAAVLGMLFMLSRTGPPSESP